MLNELNERQKEAVMHTEGPLLVLAGAGSGKTKVLTTKIAYLISLGISPFNILAITFTNKAAKEMKDRVIKSIGVIAYDVQISTFHAFGVKIIRENYEKLGYQKNFTILDSDDSVTVIRKILKDMNLDSKQYSPKAIKNKISSAKNEFISAKEYEKFVNNDFDSIVQRVFLSYEIRLKENNSLDFDDLLVLPIQLFKKNKDILENYQERFKYILIDEYQDTNEAQYILVKMISEKYKNICVVGDESQSIYSFRGSNYKNILNFEKDYQNVTTVILEKNYRSTKSILDAANSLIKYNKEKKDKNLWTDNEEGRKILYHKSVNEKEEAIYVVKKVKEEIEKGTEKKEMAVLYRTNAQSRNIEEEFLKENIPYNVIGSYYFYQRKEIKDLIAYLRLIYNSRDNTSFMRVINVPKRGIGEKSLEKLNEKAVTNGVSLYDAIDGGKELEFKNIIEEIKKIQEDLSLTELVEEILVRCKIKEMLQSEKSLENEIRLENLEEFKSITKKFEEIHGIISLEEFLLEISLLSDIDDGEEKKDAVTLMTIHAAKGLEFKVVFIVGLEEGIFPHMNSFNSTSDIEEERRLCYVAVTRAKTTLFLINAKRRLLYGQTHNNMASRFIKELGENITSDAVEFDEDKNIVINSDVEYKVGEMVRHDQFGDGIIINVSDSIITVAFNYPHMTKKIIRGHSSIKKI